MSNEYRRTHPYTIFMNLKISVILLLLPVLRQLIHSPQNIFEIIRTLSLNTIYAIGVLSYAVYSYRRYMYRLLPYGIEVKSGLFIQKFFTLPYNKIQTVNIYKSALSSLLGAAKISIDSPGGTSRRYDISAFFSHHYTEILTELLNSGKKKKAVYRSDNSSILLMCAFWSNPTTGLLLAAPFISRLGTAAGNEIRHILYHSMDIFWEKLAVQISPVTASVANMLIIGWVIAVVIEFLRYGRFSAARIGKYIVVSRGIFNRNITYTRADRIAAVTVNQSLLMRILGLYSAGIFTIGAGKLKGDKSLIIAAEKKKELHRHLKQMVRISPDEKKIVRPAGSALFSYVMLPFLITLLIMSILVTVDYFSVIDEIFKVIMLFTLIPLVWWIMFRIYAHRHSHLALNSRQLIVSSYRKLTVQKYIIPFEQLQYISIIQNPMQRLAHTCTVKVYLYYEKRAFHTIKNLPLSETTDLLNNAQRYSVKRTISASALIKQPND